MQQPLLFPITSCCGSLDVPFCLELLCGTFDSAVVLWSSVLERWGGDNDGWKGSLACYAFKWEWIGGGGGWGSCVCSAEVLIWGADNAWKPSAWVLCLIVPWYPPVTFILRPPVQSQANFDTRKGAAKDDGGGGVFKRRSRGKRGSLWSMK